MNSRSFIVAIRHSGIRVASAERTMADVTHGTRVHVSIECWIEDHNLFEDDDTATRLAGFVVRRASGMVN